MSSFSFLEKLLKKSTKQSNRDFFFNCNLEINPNCFIISKLENKDQYEHSKKLLEELKMQPRRFLAVDGNKTARFQSQSSLSDEEYGSMLSHLSLWLLCARHPNENGYSIIFEDNIATALNGDSFQRHLQTLQATLLRRHTDVIFIGKCLENCSNMQHVAGNVFEAVRPLCLHAYIIHNKFCRRIMLKPLVHGSANELLTSGGYNLSNPYFENNPMDVGLSRMIQDKKCNALVYHPALFYQNIFNTDSTVRRRKEQMLNYSECDEIPRYYNTQHATIGITAIVATLILCYLVCLYKQRYSARNGDNNEIEEENEE
jgi:GR25 family glycosyltransferase involved in LPS biosynthesis